MNALDLVYSGAALAAAPWLAFKAATDARYRDRLAERLGALPPGPPGLWFHGASVGEVNLVRPLAKRLGRPFRVTALTRAGREQAAKLTPLASYFPLDFTFAVDRAMRAARPVGIVLVELEVWPNFLSRARVPVVVVNGRITDRSFRRYRRLDGFFRRAFGSIAAVGARDAESADRFGALGVREIAVTGNLKYDSGLAPDPKAGSEWRARLGWTGPILVGGSTHEPEERILLDAYRELRREVPELRLAIAPRHVERAEEVKRLAGSDAFVLDTVGQLVGLYSAATVVFIGGTFCARGGQNMLEPAALGKPVVGGSSLSNFEEIAGSLAEAGGMIVVPEPAGLAEALRRALREAGPMGARAREVAEKGRGAMDRTEALVRQCVGGFPRR
ncbi:MAG: hypothetical protein HYY17_11950 [Planctomycetes bacterium]|nr:hypothetical protein [Planctomycetota bacterium]